MFARSPITRNRAEVLQDGDDSLGRLFSTGSFRSFMSELVARCIARLLVLMSDIPSKTCHVVMLISSSPRVVLSGRLRTAAVERLLQVRNLIRQALRPSAILSDAEPGITYARQPWQESRERVSSSPGGGGHVSRDTLDKVPGDATSPLRAFSRSLLRSEYPWKRRR